MLIDGSSLTIEDVVNAAKERPRVGLAPAARPGIAASRKFVEKVLQENLVVYGITTGVGELANTLISPEDAKKLQLNLIRSHAVGVGEPLSKEVTRAMVLLRANALAKGYSGVRPELIEQLIHLLNYDIYPFIPAQGSVGASGDLCPLSHLALVLVGEGECIDSLDDTGRAVRVPSARVLKKHKLPPLTLEAKEGLAMINGTQLMSGIGCLVLKEAELLLKNAQISGAMSLEALMGTSKAMDPKLHAVRPHPGQVRVAENIRRIVDNSSIISSHKDCLRVQDAYTLRCMPQVYGAVADAIEYCRKVLSVEINSATDNPLIFAEAEEAISGGNFHGEPLAFAMDFLGIALSEIANISERTIDRLVNPHVSGLPPFLAKETGLNSGFMIAQYTAAALVSENKILAHPASVDSIPTSAGQEDHVSMGSIAARHAWAILKNVEHVLAIEMLCAAQGMDFFDLAPGRGSSAAREAIREVIPPLDEDRTLYHDIEAARQLVVEGSIVRAVEDAVGAL